jgi:hypothetical protein
VTTFDIDTPEGRVAEFVRQHDLRLNSTSEIKTIWIDPDASAIKLDNNDLAQVLMALDEAREQLSKTLLVIDAAKATTPATRRQAGKAAVRAIIEGRTT